MQEHSKKQNRRGKLLEMGAVLGDLGQQLAAAEQGEPAVPEPTLSNVARAWGIAVSELSPAERQALGGAGGVKIAAVSEGAEAIGLRSGDVILGVGSAEVGDIKQFDAAISAVDKARALPLTVRRGNVAMFMRIPARG